MRVLVVGRGGREHAIAHHVHQTSLCEVFIAPGNAGTAQIGTNVPLEPENISALVAFAREEHIDLTIVGPESALAAGIVDAFHGAGLRIFGPTRQAATIELSKCYSRGLLRHAGVPVPESIAVSSPEEISAAISIHNFPQPVVVKGDGLAAGRGVTVCRTSKDAKDTALRLLSEGHQCVLFEEYLRGIEVSIHAFVDSNGNVKMFPPSQDHKQLHAGGPNTGGMGVIAPVPNGIVSRILLEYIEHAIVRPIVRALREDHAPFMGCLYPGLMLTSEGIKVLEVNARFGDPEMQAYLRLLETPLVDICNACIDGTLNELDVSWCEEDFATCIVLAAEGYPHRRPESIVPISGLTSAERRSNAVIFHAGTAKQGRATVAMGGRVLNVTTRSPRLSEAISNAYHVVSGIHFSGMQYREDIGAGAARSVHA